MTSQDPSSHEPLSPAVAAFASFVARVEDGEAVDFEAFCAERSELAPRLRELHANWRRAGALGGRPAAVEVGQGEELDADVRSGGGADRYRVDGEVAEGGMGSILSVHDRSLRRRLAMKVLRPERQSDARARSRFLEEAQVTAQLDHPGIVPVHEVGVDRDGRVYYTMPLVRGESLKEVFERARLAEGGWTRTRVLDVIVRVCEALAAAHARGVVHRDLKPGNVMVGAYGETFVMDWGLARVLGSDDRRDLRLVHGDGSTVPDESIDTLRRELETRTPSSSPLVTMEGDVVGTPAYMAPEQARGELAEVGVRSDLYAVGAMLYQLLAGRMPYVGENETPSSHDVLARVLAGPPPALHSIAPDVPPELVAICEKAMWREPAGRYGGAMELADDLRSFLEVRVVGAYATGAAAELRKWVQRNRGLAAVSAALVLALVIGIAVSTSLSVEARESEREVLRLADVKRLRDLEESAAALWPPHPERVPDYEGWLERARALVDRAPEHEGTLAALHALGADAGDGEWAFANDEMAWRHETLSDLVADLARFAGEDGTLRDVRARLAFAATVAERSVTGSDAARRWAQAVRSIADPADCPLYGGLVIAPQVGLLPVGRDAGSGLWEFAHLQSGSAPERDPTTGELALTPESGLVFVLVPGGTFWMGAQRDDPDAPNYDPQAEVDEGPVHEMALDPFFVSKYEMTQEQWLRATGDVPSRTHMESGYGGPLHPVESVSWNACRDTLFRLGLVLPTEAQWEYAARGGTSTPWWSGPDRASLEGAVNLADQAAKRAGAPWSEIDDWPELDDGYVNHAPVHLFRPNPFGLHHVHGNLWEWCLERPLAYGKWPVKPGTGERVGGERPVRAHRGGGYYNAARSTRSAYRLMQAPDAAYDDVGVRPVLAAER